MKHRITPEQLSELTIEQQQKLRDWWKPERGDMMIDKLSREIPVSASWKELNRIHSFAEPGYVNKFDECLPLLSIGQMIELLDNENKDISFNQDCTIPVCQLCVDGKDYRAKELCDALFEAIKEVLQP